MQHLAFPTLSPYLDTMSAAISISNLSKTYKSGFQALKDINLEIKQGEIFALLGPNGAGKTTLISIICGIVNASAGNSFGQWSRHCHGFPRRHDPSSAWCRRNSPPTPFETVWATVNFSRGLFGLSPNPAHIEKTLKALSLWDKKDSKIMTFPAA